MKKYSTLALLTIALGYASYPAVGQAEAESFIHIGALLRAGAEACNTHTSHELDELRDQQRSAVADIGVNADDFDDIFDASYAKAKAMLTTLNQTEAAELCKELEEMPITKWR